MRNRQILVMAAVMVVAAVVILHAGRGTTFWYDEWDFVIRRLGWRPHVLLFPHNEHLSIVPVVIYKLLFETVGLDHYAVFRVVAVIFDLACGVLFYIYVKRRTDPWLAVALASCVMLMGASAFDFVWPFQIGYLGSIAAGVGALIALDRETRRGDVVACILTATALGSSSVGLPVLVAVGADVLLRPGRRERWWVVVAPAALYGVWHLKYGKSTGQFSNVKHVPGEILGGLSASSAALSGLPNELGPLLAVLVVVVVVIELARPGPIRVRLIAVAALPLTFWVLAAIARPEVPASEQRYLYPTGLFLGLVVAEALVRFELPRRVAWVAIGVLAIGLVGNIFRVNNVGDAFRRSEITTRPSITAAEILGPEILPAGTNLDPNQPQLNSDGYFRAVKQYGSSPAWTQTALEKRPDADRAAVDAALVRLLAPNASPTAKRPCTRARGDQINVVPPRGVYVQAAATPVELRFRRFGDGFPAPAQSTLESRSQGIVTVPADHSKMAWHVQTRSGSPYEVCELR